MQTQAEKCVRAIFDAGYSQQVSIIAASKGKIKAVSYYDGISYTCEGDTLEEAITGCVERIRHKAEHVILTKATELGELSARAAKLKVA